MCKFYVQPMIIVIIIPTESASKRLHTMTDCQFLFLFVLFQHKPIVFIHIGQAGVQIGSAIWEQLILEHGVTPDGLKQDKISCSNTQEEEEEATDGLLTIFQQLECDKYRPNALFVDLEASAVGNIFSSILLLFNLPLSCLIIGKSPILAGFLSD